MGSAATSCAGKAASRDKAATSPAASLVTTGVASGQKKLMYGRRAVRLFDADQPTGHRRAVHRPGERVKSAS